ncbi:HD-GYP domain-containing protein [Streptomyces sp. Tu 2975]|uniref:HD-GYP domain-containing protein n=1 Tax=Streptomyces sp. Tu 2975 TaxID=2676871 RepID=UPI00135BD662|nr:HD-GYP domain-containing protein [Streptomyces sp. Tu 2975]QIP84741.1 HD-GYP domain-containing protein [Streptomyces sp. Tu 2975]
MTAIPVAARAYILAVILCAAVAAAPVALPAAVVPWPTVLLLAALYAGGELPARRRDGDDSAPIGAGTFFPVLLAAAFLLPPAAAAMVPVPGALLGRVDGPPAGVRRTWRAARLALATWGAAHVYLLFGGEQAPRAPDFPYALVPALAGSLACCLLLTVLDGGIRATAAGVPPPRSAQWGRAPAPAVRRGLSGSAAPHCVHGLAGLMMAVLWGSSYGPLSALFVLLPMYISCWIFAQYHRERAAHQATIRALVQAVDIKDRYTRGHSERVGRASVLIARELDMEEERLEVARFAGILHDVGKLGVPTRVLRKEGPLTPEERRVIELHPEYGHEMVRGIGFLGEARAAILHHHERMDGSGYPYGLVGHQIPEFARVVAVADAFDAMTSTRSYRRARPVAVALRELERCAGTQFDPRMVRALVRALERHGWQTSVTSDEAAVPMGPPRTPRSPGSGASHQIRTG